MPTPRLKLAPHYTPRGFCAVALCLLLAAPACAKAHGGDYFPLADGSRWEYAGHYSSADGKEFTARASARVDGKTLIGGKRYFKFVLASDMPGLPAGRRTEEVRYYRYGNGGLYVRRGDNTDEAERLELPLPVSPGVKWLSGTAEARAERAGTIKAGGREYRDCLKVTYREKDDHRSTEYYYARGVGIVKTVYVNTREPKSVVELTLESYHP
jgi:hypothetical protein